jgi:hypothetical protein
VTGPRKHAPSAKAEGQASEDRPVPGGVDKTELRDYSWTLQLLNTLNTEMGGLKKGMATLETEVTNLRKSVDWIKYAIFLACGALLVLGWFVDKRSDQILNSLGQLATAPKTPVQSPAASPTGTPGNR